jgi:hypothetical protein
MLYFAYGSNLHHLQMKRRCKDCFFLKKINLQNFRLTFRSKYRAADIEKINSLLKKYKYKKFYNISSKFKPHKNQKVLDIFFIPQW